ncbi:MAG: helix-turn-helix domain-containing protein, partial [Fusobacterium sp.]
FVNQMEGKENINAYTFYCGHKDYDELFWVKEMINASLSSYLTKNGYDWQRLNKEEKLNVIKKLNSKGIFNLRGGISEVSESLKISEPTIYRYLNIVKKMES